MKRARIIVGARGSMLSVAQTGLVIRALHRICPGREFILETIKTMGDRVKQWGRNDTGIFVKEIEDALREKKIDIAVHSVKDLPSKLPRGLCLAAVTRRQDPRDVLISRNGYSIFSLPRSACVGTSSLRRQAQILHIRPDLKVIGLRGNLDTRIRKLHAREYDAIIVAAAGLRRLGITGVRVRPVPVELALPQSGQGALGIEARANDAFVKRLVSALDDPVSHACVDAERAFLRESNAGCRMPVAAFARVSGRRMILEGMVISLDGRDMVRLRASAPVRDGQKLGRRLARQVLRYGGAKILKEIRNGA